MFSSSIVTIVVEHFPLAVMITMAPKGASSKDTTESSFGEEFETMLVNLSVYLDTQLYVEKESYLT